jgi:Holliday junction DNA helicase RuvA
MISYIKGELEYSEGDIVVVENNGIGYEIIVPAFSAQKLISQKGEVIVYTYMSVRDDGISLFGFASKEEKRLYQMLISVSGIGPKAAISILSVLTPSDLITAIVSSDAAAISRAQGIGKKTAQRVILDLKDKIGNDEISDMFDADSDISSISSAPAGDDRSEAVEALISLGYSRSEALKAVSRVYKEEMNVQKLLSAALKEISRL